VLDVEKFLYFWVISDVHLSFQAIAHNCMGGKFIIGTEVVWFQIEGESGMFSKWLVHGIITESP
jgi:hypothetical protein